MARESVKLLVKRLSQEAGDNEEITQTEGTEKVAEVKSEEGSEAQKKDEEVDGADKAAGQETGAEGSNLKDKKRKFNSEIKVSERYNEDDADITILSSDGVAFKVHSLLLARASSVFKNMLGIAHSNSQRDPIDLTDQHVEMSPVVKAVLDILYDQEVVSFKDDKLYHHVIEFARKYDMTIILKTISKEIRIHVTSPEKHHVLRLFRLAIDLGEYDLMTAIVRARGSQGWGPTPKDGTPKDGTVFSLPAKTLTLPKPTITGSHNQYVTGAKKFDLGGWPYASFAALPTPLAWASLRANQTADRPFGSDHSAALGNQLQKVLNQMYPSSTDTVKNESEDPPVVRPFSFGSFRLGNSSASS